MCARARACVCECVRLRIERSRGRMELMMRVATVMRDVLHKEAIL